MVAMLAWRGVCTPLWCCVLVWGCALDERKLAPLGAIGGAGSLGAPSPDAAVPGWESRPHLEVDATPVDLGPIAIGFPARARLAIANTGDAALPPPDVSWSETSNADFSVVQNQCLTDIAPGESCDLRVQLVPSTAGLLSATLRIAGAASGAVDVPFAGLGLLASEVLIAPATGSFENFGEVLVGATAEGTFRVQNPSATATGVLRFNVNQSAFAILPGAIDTSPAVATSPGVPACPSGESLPAGASCAVRIGFTPSARGPVEATLTAVLGETAGVSTTLSGAGMVTGKLATSLATLDFEGVLPEEAARRSLTIENEGDEPLTLGGLAVVPADGSVFSIVGGTCATGLALAAGASCSLELEFRPIESDVTSTAEVVIGAAGGQEQRIALTGRALKRGQLVLTVPTSGDDAFGDVLIGASLVHVFQVTNPGAQPSGALALQGTNGFEIEPSAEAGDCMADTSLVDAQSCAIHVRFAPTERGSAEGALTVSSELAGASSLPLSGNGIAPAALQTGATEINFGRVTTGTTAKKTLSLSNAGDQAVPPPTLEVKGADLAQAAEFTFESGCSAALGFEESCEVALTFAPMLAAARSATLEIGAEPGGRASVLLLGQAILPGSLQLAPVAAGGADFGDVALGAWAMRSFTLENPGGEPSGPVTLRTDDAAFVVSARECGELEPSGLVDDASCTFDVTFTPKTATVAAARLLAVSAALGEVGLDLRGRGRAPARLDAALEHDLGMLPVGAEPGADNQLTWVVNNIGDLPTGELAVANRNSSEFVVDEDSCSDQRIAARGSCQMHIVFRPSGTEQRGGSITVTDTGSGIPLTLGLTGVGQRIVDRGAACGGVAVCGADSWCVDGVCCDGPCTGPCETCSAGTCEGCPGNQACRDGACRCDDDEIDCGNGACQPNDGDDAPCCERASECPVCQECDFAQSICVLRAFGTACDSPPDGTLICDLDGICRPPCTSDAGTTCI